MDNQKVKPSITRRLWRGGMHAFIAGIALASTLAFGQGNSANHISATGAAHSRAHNVSRDLLSAINNAPGTSNSRWVRDVASGRLVQVIIIADTSAEPRVHSQRGRAELMTA